MQHILRTSNFLTGARGTVAGEDELSYKMLVSYASSLVDALLFIHYVGVILIEIRHLQNRYYIKVQKTKVVENLNVTRIVKIIL